MRAKPEAPRLLPRRLALGVAMSAVAVLVAGCGFNHPDNRPTPIAGQNNGKLPPSTLLTVSTSCRTEVNAGRDLQKLLTDARRAGISLSPAECYRDYAGQVYWRNYWCNLGRCQMAAVPGTSIHGWGKAVDFANLEFGTPAYRWLEANGWIYGWNHPGWAEPGRSSAEAWHWEWVGDGGTMFSGGRRSASVADEGLVEPGGAESSSSAVIDR